MSPTTASAQKIKVRLGAARPAERSTSLEALRQRIIQAFTARVSFVSVEMPNTKGAFEAIRHNVAGHKPVVRLEDNDETLDVLRVVSRGPSFRGRHGKLTVIRKVR